MQPPPSGVSDFRMANCNDSHRSATAAADGLRAWLLHERPRPRPGRVTARRHSDPNLLELRPAKEGDAATVEGWLDDKDLLLLGGTPERQGAAQIQNWINTALDAYVLLVDGHPRAFFAIENNEDTPKFDYPRLNENDSSLELARLVVDKAFRRQGYGTALFIHVYRAFLSVLSRSKDNPFHILLRRARSNVASADFFLRLPLRCAGVAASSDYIWYIFSDHAPYTHAGTAISARRKEIKGLSQQKLAFLACMDASTLAMVEAGHRALRVDDARRLRDVLCDTPEAELRYARDVLACTFDPALWSYPSTLGAELADVHQTLWVFSDVLAENTTRAGVELSSQAVLNSCCRLYFVPHSYPRTHIRQICQLFIKHFEERGWDKALLAERVAFYGAPGSLCSLRLAVHDPDTDSGSFSARKISVAAGDTAVRLDIAYSGDPLISRFLQHINQQRLEMDLNPGITEDGFSRISVDFLSNDILTPLK